MTTKELLAHQRAQEAFAAVLRHVRAGQLDAPTPCPGWTVRDLAHHVVGGNQRVAGVAAAPPTAGADELAELIRAHAESAAAVQAVFAAPDGLTRTFDVPFGVIPGAVCIQLRTADALTHAWDLAKATGQSTDLDPEVAAQTLEVSRRLVRPDLRGPGRPFAVEQPCSPDRPVADQLAAFLGRAVTVGGHLGP